MIFKANEQQVKEIALNAIKASKVVGMGIYQDLQFKGVPLTVDDICLNNFGIYIDYFRGRMVKLNISKKEEGVWEINDRVKLDYQSWGEKYPTVELLINTVLFPDEIAK